MTALHDAHVALFRNRQRIDDPIYGSFGRMQGKALLRIIARLQAERDGEREARQKCEAALTAKDKSMGVFFERLTAAGVDCSDLIS